VAPTAAAANAETNKPAQGVSVVVQTPGSRLNVRAGPGMQFGIIDKANNGASLLAIARNADSTWVQVTLANNRRGWAAVRYLRLAADALATLPVSSETSSAPLLAVAAPPSASAPSAAQAPVKGSGSTSLNGRLVISSGNGGLFYLYNLATGELRPIVSGIDPVISPDGQRVAFTRGGGDNGLYVINIDGSNERKLYGGSELLSAPSWSPDNSAIVFSRATGTVQCRSVGFGLCLPDLPLPPPGNDEEPGGPSLSDFPLVTQYIFGLARVKVDDKEYRDLAAVGSATTPDWNEAGILYQAAPGFKITADKPDAEIKTVTLEKLYRDPDWQPNGGRIVFTLREGSHWELFTIDSSGAGLTALTRPATTLVDALPSNVAPVWSPDGQSIVFLSNRTASNEAGAWSVWVMNSDGSNQRRLPIDLTIQYGFAQEQIVSWGR
jgi:dipeptidyl aminopeptidase/acylaminoacyl peptidase